MKDSVTQAQVMDNMKKLGSAPEYLKKLSVCYDVIEEETSAIKLRVDGAKQKTERSTNWVYKIRGPPWDLREVWYPKNK